MSIKSLHKVKDGQRLKVAAYARISSNKDLQETSLEEQIDYYTRIIVANPDWEFVGIYYDDGISGTTILKRNGFMSMVENAKAGLIDVILVKSVSRFARNLVDLLSVMRELRRLGVEIYFEQQQTSSLDNKSDQMITMYAEFAEEEAISVSQNVNWRVQKNMREGRYHLPTAQMMGYRYDSKGSIVIYEPEARTIQRIYSLYLDGYGCAQIAEFLTNSKTVNRFGQVKWERSTIRNILRNEKYVGDFLFQKTFIESPISHREKINHGARDQYIVENGHPAIISRDDWNKVQSMMDSNAEKFRVPSYKNERYQMTRQDNPFRGFVVCPHCGQNYVSKDSRHGDKINRFLACSTNVTSKICQSDNYPYEDFKIIVIEMINYLRKNTSILKDYLQKAFKDNSQSTRNDQLSALDTKIDEHRAKLKEIEKYTDEFHIGVQKRLIEIITDLTKKKIKLQNESITAENIDSRIRRIIKAFESLGDSIDSLENINLSDLFSKAVIVNKNMIYFIIGNLKMKAYPKKPKLLFTKTHKYTVRRTVTNTTFGIVIGD